MNVMITGYQGFIGRHVWQACRERGDLLVGMDIANGEPLGGGVELPNLDCRRYFKDFPPGRFDLVIHCAATVGGRATIDGEPLAVATNLSLDAEMFNWALKARPGRIVYFSSSAAYPIERQTGNSEKRLGWPLHLRENHIQAGADYIGRPDQVYGWSKLTGEMLAEHVTAAGIPVHVFRPFSGYGSDQSADYPFGAFIDRALRRDDPFEVWGDGRQTRDFIHVDDIVAAVFAAIDQDIRGPVNLCTGRSTSFDELSDLVIRASGPDYRPTIKHLSDAPTGVQYRVGDPTQMREFYEPRVSLEEGVARALAERSTS